MEDEKVYQAEMLNEDSGVEVVQIDYWLTQLLNWAIMIKAFYGIFFLFRY